SIKGCLLSREEESDEAADESHRKARENGQRVEIALVQDSKNDVHHKHCDNHENGEISDGVLKSPCFPLKVAPNCRGSDASRYTVNKSSRVAHGYARLQIKKESDTRELIQMIDCLRTQRGLPFYQGTQRDEISAIIGFDVKEREIFGFRAFAVLELKD